MMLLNILYWLILFGDHISDVQSQSNIKIYPNTRDSMVTPPRIMTLGCEAKGIKKNVTWIIPDNAEFWTNTNFARRVKNKYGKLEALPKYFTRPKEKYSITYENITDETDSTQQNAVALLTIKDFTFNDIGYYYCQYMSHKSKENKERKKIFVFVNDETRLSFLEKDKTYIMNVKKSIEKFTFPCIPTAPHITVTLKGSHSFRPWEGYRVIPRETSSYDTHVGFNLKSVDTEFDKFICEFSNGPNFEEIYFEVIYNYTNYNVKPYIDNSADVIVRNIGEDFELSCTFATDVENLSSLVWIFPKQSSNVKIYKQNIPIYKGKFHVTKITVKRLTLENEGEYMCKINNTDIYTHVAKKNLLVNMGTSFWRPLLNVSTDLIIKSGENIIISCQGNNVIWTYTENTSKIKVTDLENKISEPEKGKILSITEASYTYTGYYYCHNEYFPINDQKFSIKVFIFVEDKNNLARNISDINMQAPQYSTIIIDCIATSPSVSVSLVNNRNEQVEAKYNKHLGFEMYLTTDDILNLMCIYELENKIQTQKVIIDVQKAYKYDYIPFLSSVNKMFTFQGYDLELVCSVVVREDYHPDIKWDIPSKPGFLIENSMKSLMSSYTISNGKVVISTLIVRNVTLGDNTEYECSFIDEKNETHADRRIPFTNEFNLTPLIKTDSVIAIGNTFVANCTVRADHNIRFNITWDVDLDDNRVTMTDTIYDLDVYGKIGNNSLIINNVTYEDSRNYTCKIFDNKNNKNEKSFKVTIQEPSLPEIYESNIYNDDLTIILGGNINLTCKINENLIPKSTLQWYKDGAILYSNVNYNYFKEFVKKYDSGLYSCNVTNELGMVSRWRRIEVKQDESKSNFNYFFIVIGILAISLLILIIVFMIRLIREKIFQRKLISEGLMNIEEGQIENLNPNIFISDQAELLPYEIKWEIPRERVKIGNKLGSGEFGVVVKGEVFGIFAGETIKTVAIKMLHRNANCHSIKALVNELKIMTYIGKHLHVVNLLGACTNNIKKREILIITEYCVHGNLRKYLLKHRNNFVNQIDSQTGLIDVDDVDPDFYRKIIPSEDELWKRRNPYINIHHKTNKSKITNNKQEQTKLEQIIEHKEKNNNISTHDLLCWAFQIARGMDYLSSRRILHGDLAARNVLLSHSNIVKICDFGLAKNMYNYKNYKKKSEIPLPVKWMAIESLRDGIFSVQSDVWSFGVTLWEIFSLGKIPYPDLDADLKFVKKLEEGMRMEPPEYATSDISFIMRNCWKEKPSNRPTFPELVAVLGTMIHETVRKHYIDLNKPYENLNTAEGIPNYLEIHCDDIQLVNATVDDKIEDQNEEYSRTEKNVLQI